MSKINETNYPRRTQASYEDTDMLVIQEAGGNTYTTRLSDMRDDYQETLEPALEDMRDDINGNLATVEGSTASKIYHEGDYLVFNGVLCKVTATVISVGATLNIGTNIERAPVGDGLASLNSDLASINETVQIFANGTETYGQLLFRALRDHIVLSKVTPSATLHVTGLQCAYHVTNILSNGLIMGTSTLSSSKPYISGVMMLSNGTGYIATYTNDTTTDYSNVVATGRLDFRYR